MEKFMEIRQVSIYDRYIKDRYYAADDGSIFTQCKNNKVMLDGERRTVTKHILREAMASDSDFIIPFKDWGMYCIVLRSGIVLRRLSTYVKECNSVTVCMFSVTNKELRLYVSRVIANTFISDVSDMEVHHIDGNRLNNNVLNLQVLTRDEHRGIGNFRQNHKYHV